MDWLSEDLKKEIRQVFEPRYQRSLSNTEVEEIATNYVSFFERLAKLKPIDDTKNIEGTA